MLTLTRTIEATRFRRPIGSWLLMVPLLLALRLAPAPLSLTVYLLILCITARSLGCVLNDYADQGFDRRVSRTCSRPFAQTPTSLREIAPVVCILGLICCTCFFILPSRTALLCLAAPFWILLYASAKRWCLAPQIILGLAFSWSILIVAQISFEEIPPVFYILFLSNTLWVCSFDTTYALSDYMDDCDLPIHSLTKTLGPKSSRLFSALAVLLAHSLIARLFPYPYTGALSTLFVIYLAFASFQDKKPPLTLFYYHGFLGFLWTIQAWSTI